MARTLGPRESSRRVERYIGAARRFEGLGGKNMVVYSDQAATTPASIAAYDPQAPSTPGSVISGSKVRIGKDGLVPLFWFPDGVTRLYGKVGTKVFQLDCNPVQSETVAAAAPTTGAHVVGERVWNSAPAAGGNMGWVCTTAGTPGTWKTFGTIAA